MEWLEHSKLKEEKYRLIESTPNKLKGNQGKDLQFHTCNESKCTARKFYIQGYNNGPNYRLNDVTRLVMQPGLKREFCFQYKINLWKFLPENSD